MTTRAGSNRAMKEQGPVTNSIHFARVYEASFATDDYTAYDFAANSLGPHRVLDTVDILRTNP
jgi:hypothetical protein